MFSAVLIEKTEAGQHVELRQLDDNRLPEGNVAVKVEYSTLNYKDALAITGSSPVVRKFPMVPGIDFSGEVVQSRHAGYNAGDRVVLNGWGVGETHWGGFAQKAQVDGDWLVPLPACFDARQAMAIGTAGYTASLCVEALVGYGVAPDDGEILVTGATGGVGSVAVALLAKAGFNVVASTGKPAEAEYLKQLGARTVMDRAQLSEKGKPLQKERWAGVVDSVGSTTLANACAQTRYCGAVVCCGLAQGPDFKATVMPFILRGVALLGVDSVRAPVPRRLTAWERLGRDLDEAALDLIAGREIGLADTIDASTALLGNRTRGRVVVNVNK